MTRKETDKELDHEYDGIREFDNPLPGWWLATFYITIVFSALYVGYYHLGPGPGPSQELAADLDAIKVMQVKVAPSEGPTEESLLAVFNDPAKRAAGKVVYTEKCASCHAPDGGGLIGPNLTDKYWIHGAGKLADINKVVSEGVAEKGMPPWKTMLKPEELTSVVAYVKSLGGTKPANPKEPQGTEVKE